MTEPTLRFLDVEAVIARLELGPHDRLVLMPAQRVTDDQRRVIRDEMERFAPGVKVLIVPPGCRIAVLQCDQSEDVKIEAVARSRPPADAPPAGVDTTNLSTAKTW